MNLIVFLISWFISGLIGTIIMLIHDFRGTEYNEHDFDGECAYACFALLFLGYIGLFIVVVYICNEKMQFKRLGFYVHKLVNIGVKKEKK